MDPFDLVRRIRLVEAVRVDGRQVRLHHIREEKRNRGIDSVRHHVLTVRWCVVLDGYLRVVAGVVSCLIVPNAGRGRVDAVALWMSVGNHDKQREGSGGELTWKTPSAGFYIPLRWWLGCLAGDWVARQPTGDNQVGFEEGRGCNIPNTAHNGIFFGSLCCGENGRRQASGKGRWLDFLLGAK